MPYPPNPLFRGRAAAAPAPHADQGDAGASIGADEQRAQWRREKREHVALIKAICGMVGYQPINPAYSIEALQQIDATLQAAESATAQARDEEAQVKLRLGKALDVEHDTSVMLHNTVLAAKLQVSAQFGADSYEVTAIGLTRTSNRKRRARKVSA